MNITPILETVEKIEKDLKELKSALLASSQQKKNGRQNKYREKDILKEVRKMRKKLWNEKYQKANQSLS